MFELLDVASLTNAALIEALTDRTRAEAAAAAERLAVIAEVLARHCDDEDDASAHLVIDGWELAAAAVGAACNLGRRAASAQMRIAKALRERLPKVAEVFSRGEISAKVVATITWRTQSVVDAEALALIDAALAGTAHSYGTLSAHKAEQAIDVWVEKFDPAAVRRSRQGARNRDLHFGNEDDPNGMTAIWGRLLATDAVLVKAAVAEIAATVCEDDPRTVGQRRSEALGVLAVRGDRLACLCGSPQCPAAGADPRANHVMVYLVTDMLPQPAEESVEEPAAAPAEEPVEELVIDDGSGAPEEKLGSPAESAEPTEAAETADVVAGGDGTPRDPRVHGDRVDYQADSTATVSGSPAVVLGGSVVPAPLLAELIATGVKVTPVAAAGTLGTENRYRIPAKLAAFVRLRDMRCMFPGCGVAAQYCDLDHAVAWPQGPTHPANLGAKCRTHHLLKTFPAADGGWTDLQHPDGSHTWTAPTGHIYHTEPFGQILFPQWNTPSQPPPAAAAGAMAASPGNRDLKMPTRTRTRAQNRAQRINTERRLNEEDANAPPF